MCRCGTIEKYRRNTPVEGWRAKPDGVVVAGLHQQFPSCGGVAGEARRGGCGGSALINSPPVEGCQASPDGVVVAGLHQQFPSCGGVSGFA